MDPALEGVVLRCLAQKPADRYLSMVDLIDDLDAYLAGQLKPTPASSTRPVVWIAGAVFVALGIGIGLALAVGSGSEPESEPGSAAPEPVAVQEPEPEPDPDPQPQESLEILLARVDDRISARRLSEAVEVLDQVLERDPEHFDALRRKAETLVLLERLPEVVKTTTRMLEIDPDSAYAHFRRGASYMDLGRHADAVDDFEWVLEHRGAEPVLLGLLGESQFEVGRPQEGFYNLSQSLRTLPQDDPRRPRFERASRQAALAGRRKTFDDALHGVPADAPAEAVALLDRAKEAMTGKRFAEAEALFSEAVRAAPTLAQAYLGRGLARGYQAKAGTGALRDFSRAIDLDPSLWNAHMNRGITFNGAGELELALKDMDRAVELRPELPDVYLNRASIYTQQEWFSRAVKDLQTCRERMHPYDERRQDVQRMIRMAQQGVDKGWDKSPPE